MKRPVRIIKFKDHVGEWRWRMRVGSRIVADSGEGYKRRNRMNAQLHKIIHELIDGNFVEIYFDTR